MRKIKNYKYTAVMLLISLVFISQPGYFGYGAIFILMSAGIYVKERTIENLGIEAKDKRAYIKKEGENGKPERTIKASS